MSFFYNQVKYFSAETPQKTAIINDNDEKISYNELLKLTDAAIFYLKENINFQSSKVAILMQSSENIVLSLLALNFLKMTIIPINPDLKLDQVENIINTIEIDNIITDESNRFSLKKLTTKRNIISFNKKNFEYVNLEKKNIINQDISYPNFLVTLSSGSTGDPKPIIFSEKNKIDRAKQAIESFSITSKDIILCASPFFHSLGQRLTLLPFVIGGTLVQLSKFNPMKWINKVKRFSVTFSIPVSSHLHALSDYLLDDHEKINSLRCLVSSSALIEKSVKDRLFNSRTFDFFEMYGASEVATATTLNNDQYKNFPGSVGIACKDVIIKIKDANNNICKPNEIGEITVKSDLRCMGYYNAPDKNFKSFKNDYFYSGDLGYLNEEGYLYFADRKKDIIISGGMNIYPSDIEYFINKHQNVNQCAVVAMNDYYFSEVPIAVIVLNDKTINIEKELKKIFKDNLAPFQRPMKIFVHDSLPLGPSGKINKILLRNNINKLNINLSSKISSIRKLKNK